MQFYQARDATLRKRRRRRPGQAAGRVHGDVDAARRSRRAAVVDAFSRRAKRLPTRACSWYIGWTSGPPASCCWRRPTPRTARSREPSSPAARKRPTARSSGAIRLRRGARIEDPLGRDPKDGRKMKVVRRTGSPRSRATRPLDAYPPSPTCGSFPRPAARTRSACTSRRTAIPSSATTSTAARRAGTACATAHGGGRSPRVDAAAARTPSGSSSPDARHRRCGAACRRTTRSSYDAEEHAHEPVEAPDVDLRGHLEGRVHRQERHAHVDDLHLPRER